MSKLDNLKIDYTETLSVLARVDARGNVYTIPEWRVSLIYIAPNKHRYLLPRKTAP